MARTHTHTYTQTRTRMHSVTHTLRQLHEWQEKRAQCAWEHKKWQRKEMWCVYAMRGAKKWRNYKIHSPTHTHTHLCEGTLTHTHVHNCMPIKPMLEPVLKAERTQGRATRTRTTSPVPARSNQQKTRCQIINLNRNKMTARFARHLHTLQIIKRLNGINKWII